MSTVTSLDPRTPILVGVGQITDRLGQPDYAAMSAADLAADAARRAIADSGAPTADIVGAIDTIATTRQFDNSSPSTHAPLGRSSKFPRSVAVRLGAHPRRAVLEVAGGQSPQHLVNEFAATIASGHAEVVLLAGAEAMSTIRHFAERPDGRPDFAEDPEGEVEDRGYGLRGLVSREQIAHGLATMPAQYALLENARRAHRGDTRAHYLRAMAELFAPFAAIADANPFSTAPAPYCVDDLATVTDRNRLIADPYPRLMVARDQVNQGAAVLMTSVGAAQRLRVPTSAWVFLRGQADLREPNLLDRPDLATAPSAATAIELALEAAGVALDDVGYFDLYSCFPIAVFNVLDGLGLAPDDPRPLTLTGGLPFFGGAGNNYSMHAIVEAVHRVRADQRGYALVGANGGVLSKYSVGIYSCQPGSYVADDSIGMQREIDAAPTVARSAHPHGWASIESYTVTYGKTGPTGIVVGRLEDDGRRFLAGVAADPDGTPDPLLEVLTCSDEPTGSRFYVTPGPSRNEASISRRAATRRRPPRPALDRPFEHVIVERDGHLLTITINRPEVRNALHPPAHRELDEILDAYLADPNLWVAVITGAGDTAFCAGNDLSYSATGKPIVLPLNGFGGITARRDLTKPVIAAVNGYAMGGGLEIALACHLLVVDTTATLALSEVNVGLVAAAGGLFRLPRAIPPTIATELIVTGRRIDAEEARRLGLANRVAPAGQALAVARELAAEIISSSPTSVRLSLTMMQKAQDATAVFAAMDDCQPELDELMTTDDASEGVTAFAAKRPPEWRNR
ncbi:acetyl-CoA acetyltransferase [Mycolicibacterium stellerae]|uniref:acetyl-CoA acetyltransferase n=1 Tax=Mycolicibacterium stellerae TaxID=2358193 RepID=UPI000F0BC1A7|nr:acetyl-CoA acetyltransferase [Mycolicibacterium stellerae]